MHKIMNRYICMYILSFMSHFQNVFYSRKNYKKPELQISPHQTFEEEVALLDSLFPGNYQILKLIFILLYWRKSKLETLADRVN